MRSCLHQALAVLYKLYYEGQGQNVFRGCFIALLSCRRCLWVCRSFHGDESLSVCVLPTVGRIALRTIPTAKETPKCIFAFDTTDSLESGATFASKTSVLQEATIVVLDYRLVMILVLQWSVRAGKDIYMLKYDLAGEK
jgi:hypothetical protein